MYCTPCARLMKSITPKTSVSPAATRNRRMPSCSPLNNWTRTSGVDMGTPIEGRPALLQGTLGGVGVAVALEDLLHDLGLELAVGALGNLHQIEILNREAVGVELEGAAYGLEVSA